MIITILSVFIGAFVIHKLSGFTASTVYFKPLLACALCAVAINLLLPILAMYLPSFQLPIILLITLLSAYFIAGYNNFLNKRAEAKNCRKFFPPEEQSAVMPADLARPAAIDSTGLSTFDFTPLSSAFTPLSFSDTAYLAEKGITRLDASLDTATLFEKIAASDVLAAEADDAAMINSLGDAEEPARAEFAAVIAEDFTVEDVINAIRPLETAKAAETAKISQTAESGQSESDSISSAAEFTPEPREIAAAFSSIESAETIKPYEKAESGEAAALAMRFKQAETAKLTKSAEPVKIAAEDIALPKTAEALDAAESLQTEERLQTAEIPFEMADEEDAPPENGEIESDADFMAEPAADMAEEFIAKDEHTESALDTAKSFDAILDLAYDYNKRQDWPNALAAFQKALDLFGDDDYAPFIVIEMGNIHKMNGNYDDAITVYDKALQLSALSVNKAYKQEFIKNIKYLRLLKSTLQENGITRMRFSDIPQGVLQRAEIKFQNWRKANI